MGAIHLVHRGHARAAAHHLDAADVLGGQAWGEGGCFVWEVLFGGQAWGEGFFCLGFGCKDAAVSSDIYYTAGTDYRSCFARYSLQRW